MFEDTSYHFHETVQHIRHAVFSFGDRRSRRQKKDRAEYVIGIMHTFWHATLYAQVDRGRVPTPKA